MALPRRGLLAIGVVALGALAGGLAGETIQSESGGADGFLRRYTQILRIVTDNAPLKAKPADVVYGSVEGMLSLLDPHTNFLRPESYASMRERQQGSFHGIGVVISLRGGKVTIITPIEGTPAARVGLRAGDIIESIDGQPTEGVDLDDVAKRLRGPEGTTVTITITRPGLARPLEITLERARVPTESVRYAFLIGDDTAYIRISDFTRTTGDEFEEALQRLQAEGATRLLLDLRDNPGGIVDSAVATAGVLMDSGEMVFTTRGRTADSFQDYKSRRSGLHFSGPVVVVINRGSASAAEIVAGAIQDHDRGLLVGETSFGKGVVQTIYPLRDSGLALTTAKYYTPSGRCIQRDFDSYFSYIFPANHGSRESAEATPPRGPIYFTDGGRKVYGGGGITPDQVVPPGEYSERMARLLGQSAFFHFAVSYLADKQDKETAAATFEASPEVIEAFKARVLTEKWLPKEEIDALLQDPSEVKEMKLVLHAEICNAGLTLDEGAKILAQADDQLQAAMKLFPEAAKLQARVRNGEPAVEQAASR